MEPRHPNLPADAIEAIGQNNLIEAIKATRAATGLGLKEAKDAVDAFIAARPAALNQTPLSTARQEPRGEENGRGHAPATRNLPAEAMFAISQGNLIKAIQITRTKTGLGLKEAKDAVDAYVASNPSIRPINRTERKSHALLVAVVALLAGLIGYLIVSGATS